MSPDTRKSDRKKWGRMGGNDWVRWDGRRGSEWVVGERRLTVDHLASFLISGRRLLPPEGSPIAWKEPRPGKHLRGSSPGSATCYLLNLSELHFLICKMSLQRSLGFLKTL